MKPRKLGNHVQGPPSLPKLKLVPFDDISLWIINTYLIKVFVNSFILLNEHYLYNMFVPKKITNRSWESKQ